MAVKTFDIDGIGIINVHKSRKSKHLRLSIRPDGTIRVSIPYWVSYSSGVIFAKSKREWIREQLIPKSVLGHGDRIGKHHRLNLMPSDVVSIRSRVSESQVTIQYPSSTTNSELQNHIEKACIRALKQECENLLVQRLQILAKNNGFSFKSVSVRQLKSRWGSCSSKKDIVLSCFLIQLSWEEIDYVLLHELTHTLYMSHNADFWQHLTSVYPKAKQVRKLLKNHKPVVFATN